MMQTPIAPPSPLRSRSSGRPSTCRLTSAAVAKYKNLSVAEADGYVPITTTNYPVVHYLNFRYMNQNDLMNPNTVDSWCTPPPHMDRCWWRPCT